MRPRPFRRAPPLARGAGRGVPRALGVSRGSAPPAASGARAGGGSGGARSGGRGGSAAGRGAEPGRAAAVPWVGTVLGSGGGQSGGRCPARPSPSRPAPVWGGCAVGRRRRRGLRPAEMDLAGTIILLCSCAAGAGGEEPPGLAGPWFGAVSFPPSFFSPSLVSGARGRGRRAPLSGAPRRQGRGWAASRAPRSARRFSPPGPLPRRPGTAWRPRPFPGTFPAEDRVSCSPLFFPPGCFSPRSVVFVFPSWLRFLPSGLPARCWWSLPGSLHSPSRPLPSPRNQEGRASESSA